MRRNRCSVVVAMINLAHVKRRRRSHTMCTLWLKEMTDISDQSSLDWWHVYHCRWILFRDRCGTNEGYCPIVSIQGTRRKAIIKSLTSIVGWVLLEWRMVHIKRERSEKGYHFKKWLQRLKLYPVKLATRSLAKEHTRVYINYSMMMVTPLISWHHLVNKCGTICCFSSISDICQDKFIQADNVCWQSAAKETMIPI